MVDEAGIKQGLGGQSWRKVRFQRQPAISISVFGVMPVNIVFLDIPDFGLVAGMKGVKR